jgi:hypothetical protein
MHPSETMSKVINGKRYSVKTATLIASDEYWDGNNFERHGRNTFLYRTPKGAFFSVHLTQWQGESDTMRPLTRDEAKELYDDLHEQIVEWEEAFEEIAEEPEAGRPPIYGERMRQTAIWLPEEMANWLKSQPGSISETLRGLIAQAMKADGR